MVVFEPVLPSSTRMASMLGCSPRASRASLAFCTIARLMPLRAIGCSCYFVAVLRNMYIHTSMATKRAIENGILRQDNGGLSQVRAFPGRIWPHSGTAGEGRSEVARY